MTINKDEYFMQKALQEAEKAFEAGEVPVGAIITINEKIIAKAHNLTEMLMMLQLMLKYKRLLQQVNILEVSILRIVHSM